MGRNSIPHPTIFSEKVGAIRASTSISAIIHEVQQRQLHCGGTHVCKPRINRTLGDPNESISIESASRVQKKLNLSHRKSQSKAFKQPHGDALVNEVSTHQFQLGPVVSLITCRVSLSLSEELRTPSRFCDDCSNLPGEEEMCEIAVISSVMMSVGPWRESLC